MLDSAVWICVLVQAECAQGVYTGEVMECNAAFAAVSDPCVKLTTLTIPF